MSLEDYWEDASVCLGCDPHSHSWFSPSFLEEKEQKPVPVSPRDNTFSVVPPSYHDMQGDSPLRAAPPPRLPQQFPPPIALCSTLSIKQGGRFVLKDMCTIHPPNCSCLRAERHHGRLRLHLVETHEELHSSFCDEEDNDMNGSLSSFSVCAHRVNKFSKHREGRGQALNAEYGATSYCFSGVDGESASTHQVSYDQTISIGSNGVDIGEGASVHQVSQDRKTTIAHGSLSLNANNAGCAAKELDMQGSIDADAEKSTDQELEHAGTDVLKHIDSCTQRTLDGKPIRVWSTLNRQVSNYMDVQSSMNSPCSSNRVLLQQSFARAGTAIGLAAVS